jgi:hypothetical protein
MTAFRKSLLAWIKKMAPLLLLATVFFSTLILIGLVLGIALTIIGITLSLSTLLLFKKTKTETVQKVVVPLDSSPPPQNPEQNDNHLFIEDIRQLICSEQSLSMTPLKNPLHNQSASSYFQELPLSDKTLFVSALKKRLSSYPFQAEEQERIDTLLEKLLQGSLHVDDNFMHTFAPLMGRMCILITLAYEVFTKEKSSCPFLDNAEEVNKRIQNFSGANDFWLIFALANDPQSPSGYAKSDMLYEYNGLIQQDIATFIDNISDRNSSLKKASFLNSAINDIFTQLQAIKQQLQQQDTPSQSNNLSLLTRYLQCIRQSPSQKRSYSRHDPDTPKNVNRMLDFNTLSPHRSHTSVGSASPSPMPPYSSIIHEKSYRMDS